MAGLQIQTRSNGEITLQEETVRKFKESLRGELIRVGDCGYDDARSIWNAMIDRRPALIASCLGVADVVTYFAREHGVTLSIKRDENGDQGKILKEMRAQIEKKYGRFGPPNPTPPVPGAN